MDIVKGYINDNYIAVFSKTTCPYCAEAKKILKSLSLEFVVFELDKMTDGSEIQSLLKILTGQSTVPNIFIGGTHIGGCSDLKSKNKSGELQKILESTQSN